jgi:hypothetical protein
MNKRKLASVIVLAIVMSVATSLQVVDLVRANYYPPPSIEIFSPIPAPDVHSTVSVPLNVRVNVLAGESDIIFIRYSLDGKANVTLNSLTREDNVWYWTTTKGVTIQGTAFRVESTLDNVVEGQHTLTVYSHAADGKEMSRTREFTVDYDYVPPQVPPFTLPNGTTIQPVNPQTQTEIPLPTINSGSFQPLENPNTIPFIIIALIGASLAAAVLYFRKKSHT